MKTLTITLSLLILAAFSGLAGEDTNLLIATHSCSDADYFYEIPISKANALPKWSPETGSPPPLSMVSACTLARKVLTARLPQMKEFEIRHIELWPVAKMGSWYYKIEGQGIRYDRYMTACGLYAVILMDGSNVEPRVVPKRTDLSEVMQEASACSFDYAGYVARAFAGSTNAVAKLLDFSRKVDPTGSPAHGEMLVELLGLLGDDMFAKVATTQSAETKAAVMEHLVTGVAHTKVVKLQRPISETFPQTYNALTQK